jgi:hypothetical protein
MSSKPMRDCICADPENCTQPVPGRRCKSGDTCLESFVAFLEQQLPPAAFLKACAMLSNVIEDEGVRS